VSRRFSLFALGLAVLGVLGLVDAFWLEPRHLLRREDVALRLAAPPCRIVHLSDLHVAGETPLLRRLLREIAAVRPAFVVISGDFVRDRSGSPAALVRAAPAVAAFVRELRHIAPVYGVQGHSEHQGALIAALADAGITWLSNQGARVGPGGSILLLGLNQQVGTNRFVPQYDDPFQVRNGRWSAERDLPYRNFYSLYDPAPTALNDEGGPLAWSGYELTCDLRLSRADTAAGVALHSRYVLGEDRMIRLIREKPQPDRPVGFVLTAQGTALEGQRITGVDPQPGRWYRAKVKTTVDADRVSVFAKVWPVGSPEPKSWQAQAEDRSPYRIPAGTAGLWFAGGGTATYRDLRIVGGQGKILLERSLAGRPEGFRDEPRATRLAMALARSPQVPPETPRLVLSHVPDVAAEAAWRGIEAVLAGHTHGGQVRLPGIGALTTRSPMGPFYDRGIFHFAAPNRQGWTTLYVNPGIGTSLLPMRFDCPPRWAVVELGS
jgi:predicted MPP superfamily phosphohydrolase